MDNIAIAFTLTIIAGLSTGIGSAIALLTRTTSKRFLAVSLGFSAGVMIYVSMIEIFSKAKDSFVQALGQQSGYWMTVIAFFTGMMLIALIDRLVPSYENPHEMRSVEEMERIPDNKKLLKTGFFLAVAITIHNFPEGIATFTAALHNPGIALPVTIAIAIHNIPEGISVSVPVYYATGSRKKAFLYSFVSGLAEPAGALIGYLVLLQFMNELTFGFIFAAVAGIMVFISIDELLPAAREYGESHLSVYGMIAGMMTMALSLLLII